MPNILTDDELARATPPLKHTVIALNSAANKAVTLSDAIDEHRKIQTGPNTFTTTNPTFDPLINPVNEENTLQYYQNRRATWIANMQLYIRKTYPRATPTDDAIGEVPRWLDKAISCGYAVHDVNVQNALVGVVLAVRTAGFIGEDTTGTQMGNFQGKWRGGGF